MIFVIIILIFSTLQGAADRNNFTNIFTKILLNHIQLLMMISVFDINWSKQIKSFLNFSDDLSSAYVQLFSFDCFVKN